MTNQTSAFQQAIDAVEALPPEDQEMVLDVLHKRLAYRRQKALIQEVAEARQEYAQGNVQFGTVADFLAELDN
ncbi:MAG: hypothetical protein HC769_25795 [Cyanobacteria bacterium CRU_2_1]|nr:hypothetical protein [Cyanobacteria bacterium RU_5_0]NJR61941.1 hypothetical protein [Cyanobacteria bacterium CRU_2_1]